MLVRYWQTAIIAAIMSLMGNVVWAQESCPRGACDSGSAPRPCCTKANGCAATDCCEAGECCNDSKCCKSGNCCKAAECCSSYKPYEKNCTCSKGNKCDCGSGGKCCCKDGECKCGKSCKCCGTVEASNAKTSCCPFMNQLAKKVAIIMVMPTPMPMIAPPHEVVIRQMRHTPLPLPPHVMLPAPFPPPPMMVPPGMPAPTVNAPILPPPMLAAPGMPVPPNMCYACPSAPACCPCPPAPAGMNVTLSKANTGCETCMQLMGLASGLSSFARTPNMPSLCASALGLMSDLCPLMCGQNASPCGTKTTPCCGPCLGYREDGKLVQACGAPVPQCCAPCMPSAAGPAVCNPNCGMCGSFVFNASPSVGCSYTICSQTVPAKIQIHATPSSDELEMNVGGTCIRCKKMTVKVGDNEITLSRFDDHVRIRGEELKATAACVRSDSKDRLILEGDVVLHYKKDGHSANVTGGRIDLNLGNGTMTVQNVREIQSTPAVHIEHIDSESK